MDFEITAVLFDQGSKKPSSESSQETQTGRAAPFTHLL